MKKKEKGQTKLEKKKKFMKMATGHEHANPRGLV
jgi:hypothetical protein